VPPRPFRSKRTTDSDHAWPIAPNIIDQDFTATGPNEKWEGQGQLLRQRHGRDVLQDLEIRACLADRLLDPQRSRACHCPLLRRVLQTRQATLSARLPQPNPVRKTGVRLSKCLSTFSRQVQLKPHTTWHLDEVYLKIDGRMVYLWRAVDAEGEVLEVLVQSKRNKRAALKIMRKLLKKYGFVQDKLVTDELRPYAAATSVLGIARRH